MRALVVLLVVLPGLAAAIPAAAQAPAPAPSAAPPAQAAETFTYDSQGRRDPFLSLIGTGTDARLSTSTRPDGAAGLTVGEISVRGVIQSRAGLVAMVQGPDTKTYLVHQGDKFVDGTVKSITPQGLIIVQEVNDPLSLIKQREIRKLLRSAEGAKP